MDKFPHSILKTPIIIDPNAPIPLPPATITQIIDATKKGSRDYYKGYQIISNYLGKSLGTEDLRYWFRKAVEINRNDKSSIANQHIRGANAAAARIDGRKMSPETQQKLSDDIGRAVFRTIFRTGKIPSLQKIIQEDVVATLNGIGSAKENDVSNWAGAYYFWDTKIRLGNETKTIGEFITANKDMHQKFITVQAGGAARVVRSNAADMLAEKAEILKQVFDPRRGPSTLDRGKIIKHTDENLIDPKSDIHLKPDEGAFNKPDDKLKPFELQKTETAPKSPKLRAEPKPQTDPFEAQPPLYPHNKVQLGNSDMTSMSTEVKPLGFLGQSEMAIHSPLDPRKLSAQGNEPGLRPAGKRVRLAEPKAHQDANLEIEELDSPTPEMIENNVFKADESGRTNITEEAKLWKKNKKLALKLIDLAGRKNEFPTAFDEEMGSVNWPRFA